MRLYLHIYTTLILVLAAGLAQSCNKEEEPCVVDNHVQFIVGTEDTRSKVVTSDSLNNNVGQQFNIEAFLEQDNRPAGYAANPRIADNQAVTRGTSNWTSSCSWVSNVYTNFWSRYPQNAPLPLFAGTTDQQQKTCHFTYTMTTMFDAGFDEYATTHCKDLIYAYSRKRTDLTVSSPDLSLRVKFQHVLSAICFKADIRSNLEIVNITIENVYAKADCSLNAVPSPLNDNDGDGLTATWTNHATYNVAFTQKVTKAEINEEYKMMPNTAATVSITPNAGKKLFILIPQELRSDAQVKVKFHDNTENVDFTATAPLGPVTWEPGMKYTYFITFYGVLMKIHTIDISPWDVVEGNLNAERL